MGGCATPWSLAARGVGAGGAQGDPSNPWQGGWARLGGITSGRVEQSGWRKTGGWGLPAGAGGEGEGKGGFSICSRKLKQRGGDQSKPSPRGQGWLPRACDQCPQAKRCPQVLSPSPQGCPHAPGRSPRLGAGPQLCASVHLCAASSPVLAALCR